MSRAHIASQKVNLAETDSTTQTYFIRKRVSRTKPRLNKGMVARIVSESVDIVLNEHRDVEAFFTHKARIIEQIGERINEIPGEEKEKITLNKGAKVPNEMVIGTGE